jgi:hypothetical protein
MEHWNKIKKTLDIFKKIACSYCIDEEKIDYTCKQTDMTFFCWKRLKKRKKKDWWHGKKKNDFFFVQFFIIDFKSLF